MTIAFFRSQNSVKTINLYSDFPVLVMDKSHLRIYDKQNSGIGENLHKLAEMQAGKGLKNFQQCWHFVKFLTYFCSQLKVLSTIFQNNRFYDSV